MRRRAGRRPGGRRRPSVVRASRSYSPSCGVSTAGTLRPASTLRGPLERAERSEPVGVDDDRHLGLGDEAAHRRHDLGR